MPPQGVCICRRQGGKESIYGSGRFRPVGAVEGSSLAPLPERESWCTARLGRRENVSKVAQILV
jgi:hypothetical protein